MKREESSVPRLRLPACRDRKPKRSAENAGSATPRKHTFGRRPIQFSEATLIMTLLMFERVENLDYVTWVRRLHPIRSMRVVNGRFSSRCVVGGFGFCDIDSPDIFQTAIGTILGTVRMVPIDDGVVIQLNLEAIRSVMVTKLFQRCVELILAFPRNVCPLIMSQVMPKLHKGFCVKDYEIAAADDRNDHDYAEYKEPEFSRKSLHSERWFDSVQCNYQA